jgi:hypothetical protein
MSASTVRFFIAERAAYLSRLVVLLDRSETTDDVD